MNLATATVLPAPAGAPHDERHPLLLRVPLPSSVDARAPPRETPPASASYRSSRTWSSGHAPAARPHCSTDLTRRAAPRLGNPARSGRNPRRAAPQEGALALYNGLSAGFTRQVRPGRRAARRPPRCLHALEREHLAPVLCLGGRPSQAVSDRSDGLKRPGWAPTHGADARARARVLQIFYATARIGFFDLIRDQVRSPAQRRPGARRAALTAAGAGRSRSIGRSTSGPA
jgi:hypothetical protein